MEEAVEEIIMGLVPQLIPTNIYVLGKEKSCNQKVKEQYNSEAQKTYWDKRIKKNDTMESLNDGVKKDYTVISKVLCFWKPGK